MIVCVCTSGTSRGTGVVWGRVYGLRYPACRSVEVHRTTPAHSTVLFDNSHIDRWTRCYITWAYLHSDFCVGWSLKRLFNIENDRKLPFMGWPWNHHSVSGEGVSRWNWLGNLLWVLPQLPLCSLVPWQLMGGQSVMSPQSTFDASRRVLCIHWTVDSSLSVPTS